MFLTEVLINSVARNDAFSCGRLSSDGSLSVQTTGRQSSGFRNLRHSAMQCYCVCPSA